MASDIRAGRAFVEILALDKLSGMLPKILKSAAGKLRSYSNTFAKAGTALIGGAAALAAPLALAVTRAAEFEENLNKFNVVFAGQTAAVRAWGQEFGNQIGRSENQVLSFLANTQDLLIPLGFETGAATEMSKQLTELSIDLASFNNMQDADVMRDLHAALTGSGEVMKKYGVVVSEARVKQELLNMSLDPKYATEAQKAQARLNLILAGTTAAQGDALRSADSYTNQLKRSSALWDNLLKSIGTPVTSGLSMVLKTLNPMLSKFSDWVADNPAIVAAVAISAAVMGGLGIAAIGTAIALKAAAMGLTLFAGAGAMLSGLMTPVAASIALIAGGVYAWTRWSDSGRNALQSVARFFGPLLETAKKTWSGINNAFKAGNLALAGQIAIAGLKVVFLQGLQQITALFPAALGPLGDWLAKMGSQLAAGKWSELGATAMAGLRAAWTAGVGGLQLLWAKFIRGFIGAMEGAAKMIGQIWLSSVNGIASAITNLAGSSAMMGKILQPLLGVDMYAEKQSANQMEPERRALLESNLKDTIAKGEAKLLGSMNNQERVKLQAAVDQWKAELQALGELPAVETADEKPLAERLADLLDSAWEAVPTPDELEASGQANIDRAMEGLKPVGEGGASDLAATMADAQRQLQEGLATATAERADAEAKAKAGQEAGEDGLDAGSGGARAFATFSGVSLANQIGASSTAVEQLTEQKKASRLIAQQNEIASETQRVIRQQPVLSYGA